MTMVNKKKNQKSTRKMLKCEISGRFKMAEVIRIRDMYTRLVPICAK